MCVFLVKVLMFIFLLNCGSAERTKDMMYEELNGNYACFRRLNATHQTGCSSSRKGTTGVVHYVEKMSDIHFILQNGTSPPYVPIVPLSLLKPEVIYLLKNSGKISGLIVYKSNETISHYSHEDTCPNTNSNLKGTCDKKWNLFGTGMLREDIPYPIFFIDSIDDIKAVKDCFQKFNNFAYESQNIRPLCSMELSSFMYATTNTPTCIRRSNVKVNFNPAKFCDPLGDENVWATLFPIANVSKAKVSNNMKYIVVVARLDGTAFFHERVPGAVNPITSLVTLLTTAQLLKKMFINETSYDKNVLFVLFNGESYDYIGSQRLVFDMENESFPTKSDRKSEEYIPPIKLSDISLLIELNQLSNSTRLNTFIMEEQADVRNFITNLKMNGKNFKFGDYNSTLPPSSLQSFLRSNSSLPAIVITNHGYSYTNHYYNSMIDDVDNLNYTYYPLNATNSIPYDSIQYYIANVSNVLANTIYQELRDRSYKGDEIADVVTANELLHCYLQNANCTIHNVIQRKRFIEEPLQLYVSVNTSANYFTHVVGLTLAWFTADVIADNFCPYTLNSSMYKYYNMSKSMRELNETYCYRTIMNFSDAVSPAFILDDYDWSSGKYSSWSESCWNQFGLRLFLKPSIAHENMTIAIGSLVLVLSFVLVYFVNSRSRVLFAPITETAPTRC